MHRASIGYTVANAQCQIVGNLAPIIVVAAADADANIARLKLEKNCYLLGK